MSARQINRLNIFSLHFYNSKHVAFVWQALHIQFSKPSVTSRLGLPGGWLLLAALLKFPSIDLNITQNDTKAILQM